MRRLAAIAALALLISVPLWAQHGGGHGGGHAGFSGGHAGGFGGHGSGGSFGAGHFSGGTRGASGFHGGRGFTNSSQFSHSRGPFLHDGFSGRRFRTYGFRNYGFRNNCYGYGCRSWGYGYPWWGSGYYDPWWDQDDRRFDEDYYRQYDIANETNQQSLEQQRMLRQEEADGDQDAYAPRSAGRGAGSASDPREEHGDPIIPATLLVFRDQHKEEIRNYAIVGETLWNFTPQRTEKISLASLDLSATEKANDDRGVAFRVPAANEAQ